MKIYDEIYEIAADNYGLVTATQARQAGAAYKDLTRFVRDGRLVRLGHGVYRLGRHVPGPNDAYAECVALVGPGAYLFGESVIAMHALAPTNPSRVLVATTRRVRRSLPDGVEVVVRTPGDDVTSYEGIPSQSIPDAIRSCAGTMMPERLGAAVRRARAEGLIRASEEEELLAEVDER